MVFVDRSFLNITINTNTPIKAIRVIIDTHRNFDDALSSITVKIDNQLVSIKTSKKITPKFRRTKKTHSPSSITLLGSMGIISAVQHPSLFFILTSQVYKILFYLSIIY